MPAKRKSLSTRERLRCFEDNGGVCHICGLKIQAGEPWDVSHENPLELGGEDERENRKPAHRSCHRKHTAEVDAPAIAKSRRIRAKHWGAKAPSKHKIPGSKGTRFKKKLDGTVELREPHT